MTRGAPARWWRAALGDVGLRALAGLGGGVLLLAVVIRPGTTSSPLGGVVVPWPLLSAFCPLALAAVLDPPLAALERASARGLLPATLLRVAVAASAVVAVTAVVAVAAPADGAPVSGAGLVAWRNAAFVAGLTLAAGTLLGPSLGWLPGTAYVLACVAVGVPRDDEAYRWTVLLRPGEDRVALAIALGCLVAGAGGTFSRARAGGRRVRSATSRPARRSRS